MPSTTFPSNKDGGHPLKLSSNARLVTASVVCCLSFLALRVGAAACSAASAACRAVSPTTISGGAGNHQWTGARWGSSGDHQGWLGAQRLVGNLSTPTTIPMGLREARSGGECAMQAKSAKGPPARSTGASLTFGFRRMRSDHGGVSVRPRRKRQALLSHPERHRVQNNLLSGTQHKDNKGARVRRCGVPLGGIPTPLPRDALVCQRFATSIRL